MQRLERKRFEKYAGSPQQGELHIFVCSRHALLALRQRAPLER